MLLCGDFNIAHTPLDIRNAKGNEKNSGFLPAEREWFSRLLALGWVDVLRALHPGVPNLYSWWSNRGAARAKDVGWRIDYVLASPALAARARRPGSRRSRPVRPRAGVGAVRGGRAGRSRLGCASPWTAPASTACMASRA